MKFLISPFQGSNCFIIWLQHLLYISSEVLNQQTKSNEERLREKRQIKQQQQLQNNNNGGSSKASVSPSPPSATTKADAENRPLSTPETLSTLKRKRSLLTKSPKESAKKLKVSNATPSRETVPTSTATTPTPATSSSNSVQLPERPTPPAQPLQPPNHEIQPKPAPMPALPQQPVPMAPPKGETVLLRLSSGQVVLVPKELLKKINPVTSGSSTATTLSVPGSSTATVFTAPRLPTVPTAPRLPTVPTAPVNKFVPAGIIPATRAESLQPPAMVKQDLPANVSLNQALDILRQKCSSPAAQPQLTQLVAPKPNGILKAPVESNNGKTFRYVKVQAFQGPPGTQPASQPGTVVTQPVSSLSEQLVRIQQMPVQLAHQQKQVQQPLQQQQQRPQFIVHRTVPVPTMTRVVPQTTPTPQQTGIYRHFIVPSSTATSSVTSLPVTQIRPASAMPRFIRPNGALQASPIPVGLPQQGPMKICIIQSPRKPDGTPVSPGSVTPGIVVMNPPANFRQLNINEVFKAISAQNAAASSTTVMQRTSTPATAVTTNVAPRGQVVGVGDAIGVDVTSRIVASEANGLVPSQVS